MNYILMILFYEFIRAKIILLWYYIVTFKEKK
jgi:hypothetical protein